MADDGLVIGCNRPMLAAERSEERPARRWPTTVHAVEKGEEERPFRTSCGAFVLFRYPWHQWPPDLVEDWCPACVRAADRHPLL